MSPRPFWPRATSRSASSRFRCPPSAAFFKRARAAGATTILNPAPAIEFEPELLDLVDILDPQRNRARVSHRAPNSRYATTMRASSKRRDRCQTGGDKIICVTLGKRGVLALIDGEPLVIAGRAVKAVDTTGAGDCFVGALAAQLAGGQTIHDALRLRQRRGLDLRAADGRRAVDADGGRSGGFDAASRYLTNRCPLRSNACLLQRLQLVVLRLGPAGAGGSIVVQRDRRLAEGLAVGLDHGLAELAELAGQNSLGGRDRVGRLRRRLPSAHPQRSSARPASASIQT